MNCESFAKRTSLSPPGWARRSERGETGTQAQSPLPLFPDQWLLCSHGDGWRIPRPQREASSALKLLGGEQRSVEHRWVSRMFLVASAARKFLQWLTQTQIALLFSSQTSQSLESEQVSKPSRKPGGEGSKGKSWFKDSAQLLLNVHHDDSRHETTSLMDQMRWARHGGAGGTFKLFACWLDWKLWLPQQHPA